MEDRGKRKLLATASCQGQANDCLIDRLSELPDQVAHHILSFLVIKDLTCFGCVSKRCLELYLSTPSLNFDRLSGKHFESYDKRLRLWSYLDRYLFHRGFNKIQRFRFYWKLDYSHDQQTLWKDEHFRLEKWIDNAIRCNVENLDIHIDNWCLEPLPLPPYVLLAGSLISLSVNLYDTTLKAPSLVSFSNLECLKLKCVRLVDERLFNWISCSCKCIKELSLKSVSLYKATYDTVTIESSSLELLCIEWVSGMRHLYVTGEKLRDIIIDWRFGYSTDKPHKDRSLNICAPNLNSIKWTGSLMCQPKLGTLECLEEASICLLPSVDEFVNVSEVLSCVSSAKVLTLNKETTMALFKGVSMPLLENVWYLCIHIESFLVPSGTSDKN